MNKERIKNFGHVLLFYTLLVILWGAWVRISHSGDGCGDTWPLCRGQVIPEAALKKTWVEYSHRMMSGLYGILVIYLFVTVKKLFSKNSTTYKFALLTLVFMIIEALLGAKLVLFGLVGTDSSFFRVFAISLHQVNSLLLMGSTTAFVFSFNLKNESIKFQQLIPSFLKEHKFLFALILVAITGAWAALSTTLFPSHDLLEGFKKDFSNDSHWILRLRLSHPILAITVIGLFVISYYRKSLDQSHSQELRKLNFQTSLIGTIAIIFGISTLLMLSPTWMKLSHLALAHILWIAMIRQAVISLDSAKR